MLILYVIVLAYICAPNVLCTIARKGGEDMQAFLHAIVYWISLIVSFFLFFFLQTLLVTTSYYNVEVVAVDAPAPAAGAVKIRPSLPPPSITYPVRVSEAPPPVPDITPISLPTWSWPQPTMSFPAPSLASSTPLPSFLPPVQPSSWVTTPAAPATPTVYAPAAGSAPSSYALAGPPSPCIQEECMPLPPLLPRNNTAPLAASAPAPETWNQVALVAALDAYYTRNRTAKLPTAEWIQYFKPFPKNVVDKLISVLKHKTYNEQTRIMTRLKEIKDNHSSQQLVQDYFLAL